jgi:NAD(P)-dependent dehydrogenase (short-subunit alcohol dehydrogenase family)
VFGAYGHTGRFVVAELSRRGWTPVLSGRDSERLRAAAREHPRAEVRVASIDDPASLKAALAGSGVVINCAGPFIDTSLPIVDVAIRSGVHYGGLGDLMATWAMGGWDGADEISVAVARDRWNPTRGTRLTGQRNHGRAPARRDYHHLTPYQDDGNSRADESCSASGPS